MVVNPDHSYMSFDQYLELCRNNPDTHYEYDHGQVTMLAGGKLDHSRIAKNIIAALDTLLHNSSCEVFTSDAVVRLPAGRGVLPDVTVTCDQRDHRNNDYIQYPCLIFEVLSPSTEAVDRGRKFNDYRACPTIKEYVLVNTHEPLIEYYQREKEPMWSYYTFGADQELPLTSIGVTLSVNAIYKNVLFQDGNN